ncbi:MAG: AAA family ATPase [Byssovorax sp.]
MHAEDSRRIARWHFRMDPDARRVFFVRPPAGITAERAQELAFEPNLLVVVREEVGAPRIVGREHYSMPHVLWEISPAMLDAARIGAVAKPPGFDAGLWEEVPAPDDVEPFCIQRMTLDNYRCFQARNLVFQRGFNVLIGGNGSGKTAVLDALAEVFRRAIHALSGQESATMLSIEDVRVAAFQRAEVPVEEPQYPAEISPAFALFGDEMGGEYGWRVRSEHGGTWMGTGRVLSSLNVLDFARLSVQSGYDVPLPVFAYYRTSRAWADSSATNGGAHDERSRLTGYTGWDRPAVDIRPLEHWWNRMELLRAQRGVSLGVLDAVRATVVRSLGSDYDDVRFDAELQGLAAKRAGGPWMPFRRLSDGARNMFGMVADLAVRCARLNPHFGHQAPEKTSGIVLVDELDLHLHPSWQRRIIGDLRTAFPLVQFIATTHSPLILQSLHGGSLISLDQGTWEHPADRSIEDILELDMGIPMPQKSRRFQEMVAAAAEYQRALEGVKQITSEQKEVLKRRLDVLMEPYGDNPAYVAFLQLKRVASNLDAEVETP